ncbi:hypothetical protein LJC27_02675 [Christensenellaceae bacterium OttesenSCG-928-M15]|nr:hypothetical protein [Christensenellaceae bacterium OttesenSCG-928-M15]
MKEKRLPGRLLLLAFIVFLACALFACSTPPQMNAAALPSPQETESATPTAQEPPVLETPRATAAQKTPAPSLSQYTFTNMMEMAGATSGADKTPILIAGYVEEVFPAENAALVYDQNSPSFQVRVTFSNSAAAQPLKKGVYAVIYGTYGGQATGYETDADSAYVFNMQADGMEMFEPQSGIKITQALLNGTWMPDPRGQEHFWNEYTFDGDHLVISSYAYGVLSSLFDGSYTFSRPDRLHHRYNVTSYDIDTGELLGEWPGKLNHDIVAITPDILQIENMLCFRVS